MLLFGKWEAQNLLKINKIQEKMKIKEKKKLKRKMVKVCIKDFFSLSFLKKKKRKKKLNAFKCVMQING